MSGDAREIIAALGLECHPEGGWFRQTFADFAENGARPWSTAIYYLLAEGEQSAWHRVDAVEVWHFYAGAALELQISHERTGSDVLTLGPDILAGQRPQAVVPTLAWQSARSLGAWSLMGCTVAPGFQYSGFEMAPPGWSPRR